MPRCWRARAGLALQHSVTALPPCHLLHRMHCGTKRRPRTRPSATLCCRSSAGRLLPSLRHRMPGRVLRHNRLQRWLRSTRRLAAPRWHSRRGWCGQCALWRGARPPTWCSCRWLGQAGAWLGRHCFCVWVGRLSGWYGYARLLCLHPHQLHPCMLSLAQGLMEDVTQRLEVEQEERARLERELAEVVANKDELAVQVRHCRWTLAAWTPAALPGAARLCSSTPILPRAAVPIGCSCFVSTGLTHPLMAAGRGAGPAAAGCQGGRSRRGGAAAGAAGCQAGQPVGTGGGGCGAAAAAGGAAHGAGCRRGQAGGPAGRV